MNVIQLNVLDTAGLPNCQPSCDFCKWTNGKYWSTIRHFGYTSRRISFTSADVENDPHCESEEAPFVESCTYEVGFRRSPAPKGAAHGHAGLIG